MKPRAKKSAVSAQATGIRYTRNTIKRLHRGVGRPALPKILAQWPGALQLRQASRKNDADNDLNYRDDAGHAEERCKARVLTMRSLPHANPVTKSSSPRDGVSYPEESDDV